MKDFLGNELEIGDEVIFSPKHYKYSLVIGKITAFTPKKIRVVYRFIHENYDYDYLLEPAQLIKKPKKD